MTNLNCVVIEGRLVRDASEGKRTSQDGETSYGSFTIAVNKSKKENGEWVDQASFVDVKGFGKAYERAVPKMNKGSMVRIVGSLEQEKWTSKDGQKMSKVVVVAEKFFTEHSKGDGGQGQQGQAAPFKEDFPF